MNEAPLTCSTLDNPPATGERLPLAALLALATAGFITVMTEAMPAGLLPQMSSGLNVSQALIGQLVTLYAIGSIVAAIPLTIATRSWRRRPLLLSAIGGFAIANSITAVSELYWLTLTARFIAGVFAGLLWALLAGYASRMVAPHLQGRAITVAMLGAPLALSLGIPAGTLLGTLIGWRLSFAIMSALTVLLVIWVRWQVPDFPGERAGKHLPLRQVFTLPGVRSVLFVTLSYVIAHNLLYTYIAPFLQPSGLGGEIDRVLLVFGVSSVLSLWIVGSLIDRWLRELVLISAILFMLAAIGANRQAWSTSPQPYGDWHSAPCPRCYKQHPRRPQKTPPTLHSRCWSPCGMSALPEVDWQEACCWTALGSGTFHGSSQCCCSRPCMRLSMLDAMGFRGRGDDHWWNILALSDRISPAVPRCPV